MNGVYQVAELGATVAESYILVCVMMSAADSKYDGKRSRLLKLLSSFILSAGIFVLNQLQFYSLLTVAFTYLTAVLLSCLFTEGNPMFLATLMAVSLLVIHLVDFIVILVLGIFFQDITYVLEVVTSPNISRLLFLVVAKTIDVMLYFLCRKILRQLSLLKVKHLLVLLASTCASYVLMTYLFFTVVENDSAKMQTAVLFSWFFILSFMIVAVLLSVSIAKSHSQQQMNETLQQINHNMKNNYDRLDADRRKNNKQMHDHNKHLLTLHGLVMAGHYSEATGYLNSLLTRYNEMPDLCRSGESVIDAIINRKISEADERKIQFTYDAKFPKPSCISQVDICAILANQIDNAFEASEKLPVEKRRVHVAIWQKSWFAFFKVSNYTEENPLVTNQKLYSTKKERSGKRGYGLRSIQDTAEKYNGTLQHLYEENHFISVVSLCFHTVNTKIMTF